MKRAMVRGNRLKFALSAAVVFILWTVLVQVLLIGETVNAAWAPQPFGSWPGSFGTPQGIGVQQFSLYLSYATDSTPGRAPGSVVALGSTAVGSRIDPDDSHFMNGSRFTTGPAAVSTSTGSVYVAGPVDQPPHDEFQLGIYADAGGFPSTLIAHSPAGQLTANAWNTVPIDSRLQPNTRYWLMYNTNGSNAAVNNVTYLPGPLDPVDRAIQAPQTALLVRIAKLLGFIADPVEASVVAVAIALWLVRRQRVTALALVVAFGLGLLLEAALKRWLFVSQGTYPSGHALRTVLLVAVLPLLIPHRRAVVPALILAALVCLSRVYVGEHYWYEVVGGALAGSALAMAVSAWSPAAAAASAES